jgi:hypothetical protein
MYCQREDSRHQFSLSPQYQELKRLERDHAKEKQKLVKDKDNGTRFFLLVFLSWAADERRN